MKKAFRMFKRKGRECYYIQDNQTGVQRSLGTADKEEAQRLLQAENEARKQSGINLQLGKVYLANAEPKLTTRVWQEVMDELSSHGVETSQERCSREMKSAAFNGIRNKPIIETTSDDLKLVLKRGGSATNNYLRRLHNLALGNGWLNWNIIPTKQWETPAPKKRRGTTLQEHTQIVAAEKSEERKNYYEMLWLTGAAQTDGSLLRAENIDWQKRVISYQRKKTGEWCTLAIGASLDALLSKLPKAGFLFPNIAGIKDKDRASLFRRRCLLLKIENISLHNYRYAWAERAAELGYPERFAQAALGHKSRAVHHAYAKGAQIICPALDDQERKIIPLNGGLSDEIGKKAQEM